MNLLDRKPLVYHGGDFEYIWRLNHWEGQQLDLNPMTVDAETRGGTQACLHVVNVANLDYFLGGEFI